MAFEDLRRAFGFGSAVVISQGKLPEGFFKELRPWQWVEIYVAASQKGEACRELIARSEEAILEVIDDMSFEQCSKNILTYLSCSDPLYQSVLEKKAFTTSNYWEWQEIFKETNNQKLKETAGKGMSLQRQKNFRKHENSYLSPLANLEARESALRGMLLWASTVDESVSLCLYTYEDEEAWALREVSLRKVSETEASAEEWDKVGDCLTALKYNPLREVILKKRSAAAKQLLPEQVFPAI